MKPTIDWQPLFDEALEILVQYLQIDTTNPPGNEAPAARFLGALLEEAGIATEYVEIQPNREALFATISGDGSKRPQAHVDEPGHAELLAQALGHGRHRGAGVEHKAALLVPERTHHLRQLALLLFL